MSTAAPFPQPAAPRGGPRNLTLPLATWLRRMGFTVLETGEASAPTALEANWHCPDGLRYQVSYAFEAGGVFQLLAFDGLPAPAGGTRGLVHKAEINRLREARFLLLSNTFYAEARRQALAAGTLLPTHVSAAPQP